MVWIKNWCTRACNTVRWGAWGSELGYFRSKCDDEGVSYTSDHVLEELKIMWRKACIARVKKAKKK